MKSVILHILLIASAFTTQAYADVFKCLDNGKVIYTDKPCPNAVKKIAVDPAPPTPKYGYQADRERAQAYIKKHPNLDPVHKAALEANVVIPGMTEEQVRASLGEPTRTNLTQTKTSSRWQWVYTKNERSQYVYLEDGIVVGTN